MSGVTLSQVEQAVLPIAGPFILQLWQSTLLPAIQAKAVSGSPELQVLDTAAVAALNAVVLGELKALGVAVPS